ncbi:Y-family DNA polymerase [Hydrogenovibrio thermophilus]|uniref:Y-family DNA polymerase n=1 Tax=Hydrogenovibrio thermophilus TaxID=265883 RepID=A0A410H2A9_9GAMM|nr:Y-family DNA polymerase [Hydrogenovibrio thermophilus]QAB15044.1 Y-family DNA polymerase [Hydrogenovibrio thermophilus]
MAVFALVDGNSFYASCQVAFEPALRHRPVVVLSNNDGCIVAANARAKAVDELLKQQRGDFGPGGYRAARPDSLMYQPYFKVKPYLDRIQAVVFSSNYELYADMSSRMHALLGEFSRRQEIYSIDESFLDLSDVAHWNLTDYGQEIKRKVLQCLGLPVAVGLGHSRTQAKLANHLAKKHEAYQGVLDLTALTPLSVDLLLKQVTVDKVWGVGKRLSAKLVDQGILTAYDLKSCDLKWIRRCYSVTVERIVRELRGESCLGVNSHESSERQIISSRSFGRSVTEWEPMAQAVSAYVSRAGEKLRQQGKVCQFVTVSIRSSPYTKRGEPYQASQTVPLIYPSDNTVLLVKQAKRALQSIWRSGVFYQKASVVLSGVTGKGAVQMDCFAPDPKYSANARSDRLMSVVDGLNQTMGKGTIQLASEGMKNHQAWRMRRNLMSGRYTTRWDELRVVS